MVRRSLRIGLEVIGTLVAGLVILAGVAAYRLSTGHPFHLGFLVPYLERSLDPAAGEFHVKLDDLVLAWTGGQRLIGLRATHVRAVTKDGIVLASVPQIGVSLSLGALLRGLVAPTEIEVFNPRIHLRRSREGRFQFLTAPNGAAEGQPSRFIPEFLENLMGPPNLDRATGYLRRARLVDGTLDFDDRRTGLVWHAPKIDIELARDRQGVVGRISSQVAELGNPALFDAELAYASASGDISVNSRFSGLDIASLGLIAPDLTALSGSHLQFNGALETTLNIDGTFGAVRFSLEGGPGSIELPERFPAPVPVSSLQLSGRVDSGFDSLEVEKVSLDLGGPLLSGHARLSGLSSYRVPKTGRLRAAGAIEAQNLPVPRLPKLWPLSHGGADNARAWVVANIDEGLVEKAEARFDLAFAGGDLDNAQVIAFGGGLSASGVGLRYYRPLPPIRGARGTATFDATKFLADFTAGGVGKLQIRTGHLAITGLEKTEQIIAVEGDVAGPMKDAMELLDRPPLGYPRKLGLDPATTGGDVSTHLQLQFPAAKDLSFQQVRITAHARIEQARLAKIFLQRDLTDGSFELKLDEKGMEALGQAKLAGIPASLRWISHFDARDYRNRIAISAQPSTAALAGLGFDYRSVVNGPLGVDLVYTEPAIGLKQVSIDFDLTKAAAAIDFAHWRKPVGVPGQASLRLSLDGDRPVAITAFRFEAAGFAGDGEGRFDSQGKLAQATLRSVTLGKTRLENVGVAFAGEAFDIRIGGGEIDAQPFLGKKAPVSEKEERTRAYTVTADRLDRVIIGPHREIDAVRLAVAYDGLHWQKLQAEGTLPGGKPMSLRWLPASGATHQLSVVAEDAGSALKVLGVIDDVSGGRLTITGTASDDDPKRTIRGRAEVSEYRLVNQSALVRLLTIATLTGIADALTGEGFQMYRFESDFTKTGGRVDVPLARTWGPSLGLTASGFLDYDTDRIDMKGTVVPAYSLNSLVGKIPVVGFLLTGCGTGKGCGMFAAVFTATGKLSEPTISVNKLSALAPGFLRGVFGLFDGGESSPPAALPPNARPPGGGH